MFPKGFFHGVVQSWDCIVKSLGVFADSEDQEMFAIHIEKALQLYYSQHSLPRSWISGHLEVKLESRIKLLLFPYEY